MTGDELLPRTLTYRECVHLVIDAWPQEKLPQLEILLLKLRTETLEAEQFGGAV